MQNFELFLPETCNYLIMNGKEVKEIRKNLGLTQVDFAKKLGVDTKTVQNWESGKTIPTSKHGILRAMIPANIQQPKFYGGADYTDTLPLIPIEAVAGFPTSEMEGVLFADCEHYNVPEFTSKGAQFLIRVSGSSMYPKYSNGDILACRKIETITFFQWGKVYVLDTNQGALVKRLFEDAGNPDNVICHSDNSENYPNFSIPKSEIRSLSIVIGVIRLD